VNDDNLRLVDSLFGCVGMVFLSFYSVSYCIEFSWVIGLDVLCYARVPSHLSPCDDMILKEGIITRPEG
jgi:hypothetical protein